MKKPNTTSLAIVQEILFAVIFFVGLLGFFVFAGDVSPNVNMNIIEEMTLRAVGAMAIAGAILSVRYLRENKILPPWEEMLAIQWMRYWAMVDEDDLKMSASLEEEEEDKTT